LSTSDDGKAPQDKVSAEASLAKTREEIRAITKSILDLAKARQKLSLVVSGYKDLLGQPITNRGVEEKLLADSADYAKSIGLDENLALSMVQDLIRYSKFAQAKEVYGSSIRKFLDSINIKTVSIVGSGRMGTWFAKYFGDLSLEVILYDQKPERAKGRARNLGVGFADNLEAVIMSDLIIVSVPISKTLELVSEISKLANANSRAPIVIEISSVKNEVGLSGLLDENTEDNKIRLYSIHPLFGSSAYTFDQNTFVQSSPKDTSLMRGLFPQAIIVSLDWREHDRLMAIFLTLPHALALIFADTLLNHKKLLSQEVNLTAPSFHHMLELSNRVLGEEPEVYFEIQATNPNSNLAISDLMNSLLKIEKAIKNRSEFVAMFDQAGSAVDALSKARSK
jgi:prephenate dehydrogenase/chorismate mutase